MIYIDLPIENVCLFHLESFERRHIGPTRVSRWASNPIETQGKGVKGFDGFIKYADKMSPLGNATAMDCANYTITLFSDLTKRVTLQNLYNDGGFSNMGVSDSIMDIIDKS